MDHTSLIEKFYRAFQNKDWETMQSCYHDEIVFSDPVFRYLEGKEAKAMWHMLVISGKDLTLNFSNVKTTSSNGSCRWEAFYSFSRTGRKVHNVIRAKFEFKDEKIFTHVDSFDLWRWSRMALGFPGIILGWSPFIQGRIRSLAQHNLKKFMADNDYN